MIRLLDKWNATAPERRAVLARTIFDNLDDLTDGDVAELAEVNRTTLYTWPKYMRLKATLRPCRSLPKGIVDSEGMLDAWDDDNA